MYKLDKIDKELLRLLQANGRATISSLSEAVSLSMPAVSERVKRLESSGFKLQRNADAFVNYVSTERDVKECFRITGNYEYTLKVQTSNTSTLAELLNRLKAQPGVSKTHSIIVLSTVLDRPSVTIS